MGLTYETKASLHGTLELGDLLTCVDILSEQHHENPSQWEGHIHYSCGR